MDKKGMTHEQAWKDFWDNKRDLPEWKNKTRAEKAPAYMANASLKVHKLTPSRTETLLRKYAPGRYNFELIITLNEP